jgi:hypothetical protein
MITIFDLDQVAVRVLLLNILVSTAATTIHHWIRSTEIWGPVVEPGHTRALRDSNLQFQSDHEQLAEISSGALALGADVNTR